MGKHRGLETAECGPQSASLADVDPAMAVEMLLVEAETLRVQAQVGLAASNLGPTPAMRDLSPLGRY
jgi:hypothetical protein